MKQFDLSQLSFLEFSQLILLIWEEMKRRNPIGINFYKGQMLETASSLREIYFGEISNPTCEEGPEVSKEL